jgi:hypothetical protein
MRTCEVEMSNGKVDCPYSSGEAVDVETCYRCGRLQAFYDDEQGTKVVCAAPHRTFANLARRLTRFR